MAKLSLNTIRALPKIDLHRHLEGSLRTETLWEFHQTQKQTLHESFDALKKACTIEPDSAPGFSEFLSRFAGLRFHYGGAEEIERLASEAVEDAAEDGIVHLELRFSPVFFARRMYGQPADPLSIESPENVEAAAQAIVRGALREAFQQGMSLALIITMGREFGVPVNESSASLLQRPLGALISGIDLAGDEKFPAAAFKPMFQMWQDAHRRVTIHAGEDRNSAGATNVFEAIEMGADRIGHGVRSIEDPALMRRLADSETPLEVCLTSNVQTLTCNGYANHPLRALLKAGVRATINTDDPAISRLTLSDEFMRAERECGLTRAELRQCAVNAADAAFLPAKERLVLRRTMQTEWPG